MSSTRPLKILVTGGTGQLAQCLSDLSGTTDAAFQFLSRSALDICDKDAVAQKLKAGYDYLINCAAYTKVDQAEDEPAVAEAVNVHGVSNLAEGCALYDTCLLHFSTDYVYDCEATQPIREDSPTTPKSVYAQTKLHGELAALQINPATIVLRTSWVYSEHGHNFVKTMLRLAQRGKPISVVNDQVGTPTYARDLAQAVLTIIDKVSGSGDPSIYSVYNYANSGETTWFHFARAIFELRGIAMTVNPISTAAFGAHAMRPAYSVLDTTKFQQTFGMPAPRPWKAALEDCLIRMPVEDTDHN